MQALRTTIQSSAQRTKFAISSIGWAKGVCLKGRRSIVVALFVLPRCFFFFTNKQIWKKKELKTKCKKEEKWHRNIDSVETSLVFWSSNTLVQPYEIQMPIFFLSLSHTLPPLNCLDDLFVLFYFNSFHFIVFLFWFVWCALLVCIHSLCQLQIEYVFVITLHSAYCADLCAEHPLNALYVCKMNRTIRDRER